ncbi:MAG TPA: EAL domain-containing protein [Solirubrobacteraceae bacterium]|nr:EAL domain-containing protein [Solirubrobacteraceae bacterium]
MIGSLLLALVGVGVSCAFAFGAARTSAQHSRELFRLDANQVDANMDLEVEHETDLLVAAAAFLKNHPTQNAAAFQRWTQDVHAVRRYPELIALVEMRPTPDLTGCPETTFAGPAWITRFSAIGSRAICQSENSRTLARGSAKQLIYGIDMLGMRFLGENVPVYSTASVPKTAAGRAHAFVGAIAIALYPQVLLRDALSGFPGVHIDVRTKFDRALTFSAGPRTHGLSITTPLANGLTEVISGNVQGSSIWDDKTAVLLLVGGTALSLLLAVTLFLLGTGRARAVRLVDEKTGELAFQALHDGLTGLPNRVLVMDRIGHALARSARVEQPVALLFIDFDGFKTINDTFGHGAGDQLLRTVGSRLGGLIREADTVGRLGGDEFVVLLEPGDTRPSPELVAERILELLNQPIELDGGVEVRLTASVGIAVGGRETTEQLLRDADLALYSAKQAGKNRYVVFEDTMQTAIADRHALEVDLKRALAHNELYLVYQPTFRLDDRKVGGVEALLRWQHPTRGLIPPDRFIPIAEDSGLILEIGRWVATQACHQAANWRERGLGLTMSINVSGKQIDEPGFVDEVSEILDETGLDPAALTLEITETSLMRDPQAAAARLQALKHLGVRIAIDDFGTGYSSLAYLREFPVDSLKIDRTFVSGLENTQDASAFVTTLVQLGRQLNIQTLGEGIEDEEQLRRLLDARCDYGQGFLLARPLPAEQLEALLTDERSDISALEIEPSPPASDEDPLQSI